MERLAVELDRVPETLLWTLYHRAVEARRPGAALRDPKAVELLRQIDFPFEERFGSGEAFSQWQALRALCFDRAVERFLTRSPDGTVAALGEGLETQFWRVDNGRVRWLTVDLPEVVELRQRLLPGPPPARDRVLRSRSGVARRGRCLLGRARDRAGTPHVPRSGRSARAHRTERDGVPRWRHGPRRRTALARRAESARPAEDPDGLRAAAVVVGIRPPGGATAAGAATRHRVAGAPPAPRPRARPRSAAAGSSACPGIAAALALGAVRTLRVARRYRPDRLERP